MPNKLGLYCVSVGKVLLQVRKRSINRNVPNVTFEAPWARVLAHCAENPDNSVRFSPASFSFNNLLMKPVSDVSRNSTSASVKAIQTAMTCGWTSFISKLGF